MPTIQNLDLAPDSFDISLHPLRHGHVTNSSFLRVKTIPTNQHKFFQHVLSSLTFILENFPRRSPNIELLQARVISTTFFLLSYEDQRERGNYWRFHPQNSTKNNSLLGIHRNQLELLWLSHRKNKKWILLV